MKMRVFLPWALTMALLITPKAEGAEAESILDRLPNLFPDYTGVTLPPNLAPCNHTILESGTAFRARWHSVAGRPLELQSREPQMVFPETGWRQLLQANRGQPLYADISLRTTNGVWVRFKTITNWIASEDIDGYLTYRLLKPLFNYYHALGIYQRRLETFDERPILRNSSFSNGCLNCHTFLNHQPEPMALQIRSASSHNPMLLVKNHEVIRIAKTAGYLSWHPSGRLLAYSANKLSLFFHTAGSETRDVFDENSNLGVYRLDSNSVVVPPAIALTNRNETWPNWSPDGNYLYYCSGPRLTDKYYNKIRYDLMRISFDLERNRWGTPELMLSALDAQSSLGQPRVSPDGKYLLFCMFGYSHFPIYQTNSDLCLMDIATRQYRRLEINSDQADTWHCWSSNGRWIVFSSKRRNGLFTYPYFSYFDRSGRFAKPLLLPQKSPAFYDTCLNNFNVPELTRGPVTVSEKNLARAINAPDKVLRPATEPGSTSSETHTSETQTLETLPYYPPTKP
jgi:hypothetical protein